MLLGKSEAAERAAIVQTPKVLMIVEDDVEYADVGFYGCREIATPPLDVLAKDGVRSTQGYVAGPYCSPTRAATP
jgi:arylsulfatase A-like enzyme